MIFTLAFGALLDIDGKTLRDPRATLGTLVMFSSPSCEQCRALRPHLEDMQRRLNADGAPILAAALDAVHHPERADELHVRSFPSFAFYPSHASAEPTLFDGSPSLRPLVRWTMSQLMATTSYQPRSVDDADRGAGTDGDGVLHPGASQDGARSARRMPPMTRRADAPPPLRAALPVECDASASPAFPPLSLAVGGDLALPLGDGVRVAVARWDVSAPGRWVPLGAATTAAAATREGALAGVARVVLHNASSCLYAAGTLRPANAHPDGHDGREECVVVWSAAAGGWRALHGPLRRSLVIAQDDNAAEAPDADEAPDAGEAPDAADVYAALDGPVHSLVSFGSHLFVGGGYSLRRIDRASGVPSPLGAMMSSHVPRFVAAWDARLASWAPLGAGVDAAVHALAVDHHRHLLYACGAFATAAGAPTPSGVALWDMRERVWRVPPPVADGHAHPFVAPPAGGARLVQIVLGGGQVYVPRGLNPRPFATALLTDCRSNHAREQAYARSDAGLVHVLGPTDGAWTPMPAVPTPLRSVSAMGWLPRHQRRADDESGDEDEPTAQTAEGRLVVGGDFIQYGDADERAATESALRGDWYGVASWEHGATREWSLGMGGVGAATTPRAGSALRWGSLEAMTMGHFQWHVRPQPPAAPMAAPPAAPPYSLLAVGQLGDAPGIVEWRSSGESELAEEPLNGAMVCTAKPPLLLHPPMPLTCRASLARTVATHRGRRACLLCRPRCGGAACPPWPRAQLAISEAVGGARGGARAGGRSVGIDE